MPRINGERTLNPGILRHQITWWKKPDFPGRNSFGEEVWDPEEVIMCRAQVRSLTGQELEAARQRWAEAEYEITQHWFSGLRPDMWITWRYDGADRTLDVLSIQDRSGTGRVQVVIAKEHV